MPGKFATWSCILILFYDPGLTPYIPKFWSFWFHQLLGSTRWLAHQIPAPARATGTNAGTKNTKGWRNHKIYCHSMTDFSEVIENVWKPDGKIKRKQGIRFNKAKLPCGSFPREVIGIKGWIHWIWLTPSSHVRPYPPTSDETPVTLSPQSANHQTGGSILKDPNMRLVF